MCERCQATTVCDTTSVFYVLKKIQKLMDDWGASGPIFFF